MEYCYLRYTDMRVNLICQPKNTIWIENIRLGKIPGTQHQ